MAAAARSDCRGDFQSPPFFKEVAVNNRRYTLDPIADVADEPAGDWKSPLRRIIAIPLAGDRRSPLRQGLRPGTALHYFQIS